MEDSEYIKDIPVGILLIVLAQFLLYGVLYFAKFPQWWETACIILFTLFANRLIGLGINLIRGFNIAKSDEQ